MALNGADSSLVVTNQASGEDAVGEEACKPEPGWWNWVMGMVFSAENRPVKDQQLGEPREDAQVTRDACSPLQVETPSPETLKSRLEGSGALDVGSEESALNPESEPVPENEERPKLDLSLPPGRSNGVIAAWLESTIKFMSDLEEREKAQALKGEGTQGEGAIGPWTLGLFALSSLGMITVGFKLGVQRQVEQDLERTIPGSLRDRMNKKFAAEESSGSSLRDRVNQQKAQEGKQIKESIESKRLPKLDAAPKKFTSGSPSTTAARALGLATLLTVSTATFVGVGTVWYFDLASTEDLILRLKRNVPEHSDRLRSFVGPSLESIRDNMQSLFSRLRPAIAPAGSDGDLNKNLEQERRELRKLGMDVDYLLDPAPEPIRNVGKASREELQQIN